MTEAERYSAKGFVAKPEKNKGAQKQEIWTECIQELAQRPNFDRTTKNVLERIATQSNVPRKKPKFINFLKSSMRYSPNQAEKIWTIIEEGLEEFKKKSAPATSQEPTPSTSPSPSETAPANNDESTNETKESESASSAMSIESVIMHALTKSDITKSTKKVLKKLQKCTDIPLNVQTMKKKKFANFLQKQFDLDEDSINGVWNSLTQSVQTLSSESSGISIELNNGKKRKNTSDANEETTSSKKPKTEVSLADSTTDEAGESTFDWQKHILRIFNKNQSNNQFPIDALKSKVIKKFLKSTGDDESSNGKYDKKFKKNLKKINQLTITNGIVLLNA